MREDEWVTAALTDDTAVVELLLRLKYSSLDFSYVTLLAKPPHLMLPPLGWGNHQPRSKPATTAGKEREPTRFSPTTPLSWSGGGAASPSDGSEESSRPSDRSADGRSKGAFTNESAMATTNQRSRKKKTFAELKEEESLLLKEEIHLKRELASLCLTLKEQRARNENLKRIKLDLNLQSARKMESISDEPVAVISNQRFQMEPPTTCHARLPRHAIHADDLASSDSTQLKKERCFILPDLNMSPSKEESSPETLYGMS